MVLQGVAGGGHQGADEIRSWVWLTLFWVLAHVWSNSTCLYWGEVLVEPNMDGFAGDLKDKCVLGPVCMHPCTQEQVPGFHFWIWPLLFTPPCALSSLMVLAKY